MGHCVGTVAALKSSPGATNRCWQEHWTSMKVGPQSEACCYISPAAPVLRELLNAAIPTGTHPLPAPATAFEVLSNGALVRLRLAFLDNHPSHSTSMTARIRTVQRTLERHSLAAGGPSTTTSTSTAKRS